jgi:carbamoyl-phosphate synthase small subunit
MTGPRFILALEDGRSFFGFRALDDGQSPDDGASIGVGGEVVFCTAMTGYQEICTDPSFRGQITTLTYPLIDNYGINAHDMESSRPWLTALVVREYCARPSNWRTTGTLSTWLASYGIPVIHGIDTRALTRHLRVNGAMRAIVSPPRAGGHVRGTPDPATWVLGRAAGADDEAAYFADQARALPTLEDQALVHEVSASASGHVRHETWAPFATPRQSGTSHRVVLIDCGVKHNIARSLVRRNLETVIVPYDTPVERIIELDPAGVVIGNGPGDPGAPSLSRTVATLRSLIEGPVRAGRMALTAVCLGHQVMGLAIGARTSRLKYGHRGANHPVRDLATGRVHITSQNHGFQVDATTIPPESGFAVSHVNANDGSVEGLAHRTLPIFTVQYHPEASPGPQDNQYLFDRFASAMDALTQG